ncbi:hypothetical protein L228DRAFT_280366 [Xylona heveae TC161]|uniref:Cytochrome b561 domain-containing protein n=1 Tax=Xylona heveae (strain CBS 132557 / TC161) TaxID=1328760 RepID=A0A165IMF2_XYLHT|nr:hypothetical protein L228DRAFT_280366 [Xylona heveae TC161]KZF25105.1 hypothetical protein L228DRAFT_280366 [Xylona heveae TC161]
MSPASQLAPPGSSSYSSNTMSVGDGTWDASRNTFLLPNLMGLNFATMRYNGMGNRFRDVPQYHTLILGHGILAAIVFILIVPSAIFIARFYDRQPRWALRLHIWLQILTVGLTTVIFILGWFAVGPERSLTNPHHGIGLAIYVIVLYQAISGWWVHSREKGRLRTRIPLKLMLHQWIGRALALLGFVQIGLGLTLYGSPVVLFVLYALAGFFFLLAYFILSYIRQPVITDDGRGSYISGPTTEVTEDHTHNHGGLGTLAAAGAAGAALAGLSRRRSRSRNRATTDRVSRRPSASYIEHEKYSDVDQANGTWKDRLLKGGALIGGLALAKNLFGRKKDERDSDVDHYTAPLGGAHPIRESSLSRVEEGRPSPLRSSYHEPFHRRSVSGSSISSQTSFTGNARPREHHTVRDGLATLGALGLMRELFRKRRERKEERRLEDLRQREIEDERLARANSRRFTGDGLPPPPRRRGSFTETTDLTETDTAFSHHHGIPPPVSQSTLPTGGGFAAGSAAASSQLNPSRANYSHASIPPAAMPPMPPDPQGVLHPESSGSELYTSPGGRPHHRHHLPGDAVAAAAGLGAGAAAYEAGRRRDRSRRESAGDHSITSPPVSVKLNIDNERRQVTLRRLSEQEAAAERAARRREKSGSRYRAGSASELSRTDPGERWRRTEAIERAQAEDIERAKAQSGGHSSAAGLMPPPPMGSTVLGGTSIASPGTVTGTYDGTGTEASADFANNRRRRRAERARQASRGGGRVDFT